MKRKNRDIIAYGKSVTHYDKNGIKTAKQVTFFGVSRYALSTILVTFVSMTAILAFPEFALAALDIVREEIGKLWELRKTITE